MDQFSNSSIEAFQRTHHQVMEAMEPTQEQAFPVPSLTLYAKQLGPRYALG